MGADAVKISGLLLENVKRVKAVRLHPGKDGLTVIGGRNGQGKTSILDAIAWALGGAKYQPSSPQHEGAMNPPLIEVTLTNGIVVRRDGKSGTLKVTDPSGKRAGQALLDDLVSQFALDLPKFMSSSAKEKSLLLLKTLGIGDELAKMDADEDALYSKRTAVGQIAASKDKHATELPEYPDAPDSPVSVSDLLKSQQEVLARNGENQKKRQNLAELEAACRTAAGTVGLLADKIAEAEQRLVTMRKEHEDATATYLGTCESARIAKMGADKLQDESTAELEAQIADFESINAQVAANMAKHAAADEAAMYKAQYDDLTEQIEQVRRDRLALLNGANLPLEGLSVEKGELMFGGRAWDCMSGSEQLRVAVAIVRRLNPDCGFVLLDKLEQMDAQTMREFGQWLTDNGMQAVATRVSTSADECALIIEDGLPVGESYADVVTGIPAGGGETNNEKGVW
jgi:hypothetical protein